MKHLKSICIVTIIMASTNHIQAQGVAFNTTGAPADPSAMVDVSALNKGLLIPRLTTVQRDAISSPATGLLVYQTDGTAGFYYYDGSAWQAMAGSGGGGSSPWTLLGTDIYNSNTGRVGVGTTTPLARLHVADSSVVFSAAGTAPGTPGLPPVSGAGRRTMWYPDKGAFRAGYVSANQWDKDSTGKYSIALGFNTIAKGSSSFAAGSVANASGDNSVAIGSFDTASGISSTAIGRWALASGTQSMSLGTNTKATGANSLAMGNATKATGTSATSMGKNTLASGLNATAMGVNTIASAEGTTAMGQNSIASGFNSTAMGYYSNAVGDYSTAFNGGTANGAFAISLAGSANGDNSVAIAGGFTSGLQSVAIGNSANAGGDYAVALGLTNATGEHSTSMGNGATASGANAVAMGNTTVASGLNATALGANTEASAEGTTAMGQNSIASGFNSTAIGYYSNAIGDYSTAFNGGTANGSFAISLGGIANGDNSLAIGGGFSNGLQSVAIGNFAISGGHGAIAMGENADASGDHSVSIGNNVGTDNHEGAVAIGDRSISATTGFPTVTNNDAANQMMMRFSGGYKLYSDVDATVGAQMTPGGNSWSTISDVRKKEHFAPLNGEEFLNKIAAFKLTSWNYKGQDSKHFRHYGPMAQDFYAAFGKDAYGTVGNDTTINQADMEGVSFVAIQALEKRTREQEKEIAILKKENEFLRSNSLKMAELTTRMEAIEASLSNNNRLSKK